jgi:putative endonuclease
MTGNLEARLRSHNILAKSGWTVRFRPWTLVHTETFDDKNQALIREKQLKSHKGRDFIRSLIGHKQ